MKILVIGASGATGRLLVEQLLNRGHKVKSVVRTPEKFAETIKDHDNLTVIKASILDLSDKDMAKLVDGCEAVASCLGHNLTLKGMFGNPRQLVTDATSRLCSSIRDSKSINPVKFVLMNTTGNRNLDLNERISFAQKFVIGLIRLLLPPQADNEKAAEYLRSKVGQKDDAIQWVAVRPDSLIDEDEVSNYDIYPSPIRSAIFDAGKTSRINVSHFMADLITLDGIWSKWKGQMPVIYNKTS